MVGQLKLVGAIMVTLFAMGFEAQAYFDSLLSMCQHLDVELSSTPGSDQMNPKELISLAKSLIGKHNRHMGNALMHAWATVVGPADCKKSSLQIVQTIADCSPGSGFGILNDATKEYARKCLGPEFWRDEIAAKSESRSCLLTGCLGGEDLKEFISRQYLLDYKEEEEKCKNTGETQEYCSVLAMRVSLAKAVSGDFKEDVKKLKSLHAVHAHLNKSLYKPCSNLNLPALKDTIDKMGDFEKYIGVNQRYLLSLDESSQEDVARYILCRVVKNTGKHGMSRLVMSDLEKLIPTASE